MGKIKNKEKKAKNKINTRNKSIWVAHISCSSCNGCDLEARACFTPIYDAERFGIVEVGDPKHADVLLVTGCINHKNGQALKDAYDRVPEPKAVVAAGACACTGGIFSEQESVLVGIDAAIPVDIYVPGCSPRPEAVLDGILLAAEKLGAAKTSGDKNASEDETIGADDEIGGRS